MPKCANGSSMTSRSANPFEMPPSWVQRLVDAYGQAYQIPDDDRPRFAT